MVANQEAEAASPTVDPMRLASRWRCPAEWEAAAAELEAEPAPSELNTVNSSGLFAVVSPDKMSVRYHGSHHHGHDVGVVQADRPAPTRRAVYYFEMGVRNAGHKGQTSIGFTSESFKMRRQPGWESNSCGYHGDDGCLYRGHGKGESFGPKFTSGDTIGAGINYLSQEFFFTKNGSLVGAFQKDMKGPLYPTIAVHSQDEEYFNLSYRNICQRWVSATWIEIPGADSVVFLYGRLCSLLLPHRVPSHTLLTVTQVGDGMFTA